MGFFSWKTQDTNESISNRYSNRETQRVYMLDGDGHVWIEENYEGYGRFGGKDFYVLLAEMNGFKDEYPLYEEYPEDYEEEARSYGIDLAVRNNDSGDHTEGVKYPNLVSKEIGWVYDSRGAESCEYQGYFDE